MHNFVLYLMVIIIKINYIYKKYYTIKPFYVIENILIELIKNVKKIFLNFKLFNFKIKI